MNKFTDIFANFIEGFSFRQGSQDVKQVKKGAFLKAFTITLIIGLIGEYAFLIPLNLRSPQFIIYFCILLLIFNGLYFMWPLEHLLVRLSLMQEVIKNN